jgi:hypothetical protein
VRESGPPAARIFGRQEDRRTVPGLAQRGDVAQRQRAAGGGGFENARGLTARSAGAAWIAASASRWRISAASLKPPPPTQ